MINKMIERYKRMRTEHYLTQSYSGQYAFVGIGQHSICNLYPVLRHLGVRLKYICVTSERKARLVVGRFPDVKATVFLDEILDDEEIDGIFVSAAPSAHFRVASKVLHSGKSLFIEKPPCETLDELELLIELQEIKGSKVAMVGLQKRYAPAVQVLKKRLRRGHVTNYDLHYCTGTYPEGNALLDLYIHQLDMVTYLFGKAEVLACRKVADCSYILMLRHGNTVGTLELSTAYTWTDAEETLSVCTSSGIFRLGNMERLTYRPKSVILFSYPMEKVLTHHTVEKVLFQSSHFMGGLTNNQVYTQGFYGEIKAFLDAVEGKSIDVRSSLKMIRGTYGLLSDSACFS